MFIGDGAKMVRDAF